MSDMDNMRVFADQLWKYMVPKLDSKFASNVSYFRAKVKTNLGNNTLEVERPLETGTLTLPCTTAMSGATAGQQVAVLVMGNLSNAIVVGDGKMNFPYLPLTGGTLNGSLTLDPTGNAAPVLTLVNAEKEGVGASRVQLRKNASASGDYGSLLTDFAWGDETTATKFARLTLWAASGSLPAMLQLTYNNGSGSSQSYRIYGQHNKPTIADVTGLEARLTAIEDRLTALENQ